MKIIIGKMLEATGAGKGAAICVQSSLRGIEHGSLSPSDIISELQSNVGDSGTVIMPAYNFHAWTEQKKFDYHETPSEVGALTEYFRKSRDVQRTQHPIHSLSVWGALSTELQAIDSQNSFGNDSVFARLLQKNNFYITLGTGLAMPFLPCHYTEHRLGAGYRRLKTFSGTYVDRDGAESAREYGFDVKKDEFRQVEAPVYKAHIELHRTGVVKMQTIGNTHVCWARAGEYDDGFAEYMRKNPRLFNN